MRNFDKIRFKIIDIKGIDSELKINDTTNNANKDKLDGIHSSIFLFDKIIYTDYNSITDKDACKRGLLGLKSKYDSYSFSSLEGAIERFNRIIDKSETVTIYGRFTAVIKDKYVWMDALSHIDIYKLPKIMTGFNINNNSITYGLNKASSSNLEIEIKDETAISILENNAKKSSIATLFLYNISVINSYRKRNEVYKNNVDKLESSIESNIKLLKSVYKDVKHIYNEKSIMSLHRKISYEILFKSDEECSKNEVDRIKNSLDNLFQSYLKQGNNGSWLISNLGQELPSLTFESLESLLEYEMIEESYKYNQIDIIQCDKWLSIGIDDKKTYDELYNMLFNLMTYGILIKHISYRGIKLLIPKKLSIEMNDKFNVQIDEFIARKLNMYGFIGYFKEIIEYEFDDTNLNEINRLILRE